MLVFCDDVIRSSFQVNWCNIENLKEDSCLTEEGGVCSSRYVCVWDVVVGGGHGEGCDPKSSTPHTLAMALMLMIPSPSSSLTFKS